VTEREGDGVVHVERHDLSMLRCGLDGRLFAVRAVPGEDAAVDEVEGELRKAAEIDALVALFLECSSNLALPHR
jgi:hypothetical protein